MGLISTSLQQMLSSKLHPTLKKRSFQKSEVRECEKLEQRLALSVTDVQRPDIVEDQFGPDFIHPGQLVIASDAGSDVYLQQVDITPDELLIADNGSFLDYMAIENSNTIFSEFIVTNGSEHKYEEPIVADAWWLFPTKTNDTIARPSEDLASTANLTTTRLALNRPTISIGQYVNELLNDPPGDRGYLSSDFFGEISYKQADGELTTWTYSAWDGSGNTQRDYVGLDDLREGGSFYITSGPGYGGGPISFRNTLQAPITGLKPGQVFPRRIGIVTETNPNSGVGDRHYLECEWSAVPTAPPLMTANYFGYTHLDNGVPQNTHDPLWVGGSAFPNMTAYSNQISPLDESDTAFAQGIAMRTNGLNVTVPRAVTDGGADGAPSLGIIPGTASGKLVIGGDGQPEVFEAVFKDHKNARSNNEGNPFTFFFDDFDNFGAVEAQRQFGIFEEELETNIVKDLDWRFLGVGGTFSPAYIEGNVSNASSLVFELGSTTSLLSLYGNNATNPALRGLDGINVPLTKQNLEDGTAKNAVRVEDLEYHVYVKPTVTNEVYFVAGADFTRAITVDLLSEGSSVFVNNPIRVQDPQGDIDLRATNVHINAPTETKDYFILGRSNSENSPRLPRESDPQGGEQSTPTFRGTLLDDTSTTRPVAPTTVLNGNVVESLAVLPGREGYGYDPTDPPQVTIQPAEVTVGEVEVVQVSGGVTELILDATGNGYTGIGVGQMEFLDIEFDDPQLRTVGSINRFTKINDPLTGVTTTVPVPEGYLAAPVIAISAPEIELSVSRIGYGETAVVTPDQTFGNGIKRIKVDFVGKNYSKVPELTIQRTDGLPTFTSRIPVEYQSSPKLDVDSAFELVTVPIMSGGDTPQQLGVQYIRGNLRATVELEANGFGLNLIGNTKAEIAADLSNFEIIVSGGHQPGFRVNGFLVTGTPAAGEIEQARLSLTEALIGTLAWKGNSLNDGVGPDDDDLQNFGKHYELAPDVQFIGSLTAEVPLEFGVDEDGDGLPVDGGTDGDPVIVDMLDGVFKASLNQVQAYADGTTRFPMAKGKFRDVDYLSLLNDPLDNYVTALASIDGQNYFRVVPEKVDGIDNFYFEATGSAGKNEIVLGNDFNKWTHIKEGLRVEGDFPGGSAKVITWFQDTNTIVVDKPLLAAIQTVVRFGPAKARVDEYTQQFAMRMARYDDDGNPDQYFDASNPSGFSDFNRNKDKYGLGLITEPAGLSAINPGDVRFFKLYFNPWFEPYEKRSELDPTELEIGETTGQVDQELKAFAEMSRDPARGRAAISDEQITYTEVTHPGSGYIRTPGVTIGGGGAQARAIVTGGIYEIKMKEAGFNYQGDVLPGFAAEVLRDTRIPVFEASSMPFGASLPVADFIARNTSIRGGSIVDPGYGLKIIGAANSEELAGFISDDLVIEAGAAPPIEAAVFEAVVQSDGRILGFRQLSGGTGYRIAPIVTVEQPIAPSSATAMAHIDSSAGTVSRIELAQEGYRYKNAPRIFVMPPTPRGEGRTAQAVAVLGPSGEVMRIDVTDPGSGYRSPPVVKVQAIDAFNVVENVDIAAQISADKYEIYLSRSDWTDKERGSILLRPTNTLGNQNETDGKADWVFIEAAATDMIFEGDVAADSVTFLMNSRNSDRAFAPYTLTTESTATGLQSGTIDATMLVVTMGNDIPTPLSGGTLENRVSLQTDVDSLRVTAAESQENPRGAFPYDIHITEVDGINIEAVPRSSGKISLDVPNGKLNVSAGIFTDGDIAIKTSQFNQTTPLVTEFGAISIEANSINVLNSLLVKAAPLDERETDISLHATNGSINLQGTISSPNSIVLRQESTNTEDVVGGNTRIETKQLVVNAVGDVDILTDVYQVRGGSDGGDFSLIEANDIDVTSLQVPNGSIKLTAEGVDRGGEAINPIALKARIVSGQDLFVSAPNGSMNIDVDTSSDLNLGILDELQSGDATTMEAAGSVRIINASGNINVYDGPIAGLNAKVVKAASTSKLPDVYSYQGNVPGEFPSELSGPGSFPADLFQGDEYVDVRVGDRLLVKDQFSIDQAPGPDRINESRENGIYEVMRLGGGSAGFSDWLLRRVIDGDSRQDLPSGTYVRVREGKHENQLFQLNYSVMPEFGVTRTQNSQLVIDAGVGGLLGVDLDTVVTGEGILPGARVTGVDLENGVVTLGVGNGYEVSGPNPTNDTVVVSAAQGMLFDAFDAADRRGEKALISGDWFPVGTEVKNWDRNTGVLTLTTGSVLASVSGKSIARVGFVTASSDRVSLNPAVRTFLVNAVSSSVQGGVELTRAVGTDKYAMHEPTRSPSQNTTTFESIDVNNQPDSSGDFVFKGWAVQRGDEVIYFKPETETGDVPAPDDPNPDRITNLFNTSDLLVDMTVTGTNIPDGATIASIDSANNTITLSAPVTTGAGVVGETLTFPGGTYHFTKVIDVKDGSDDPQDDIAEGIKRITFADRIELKGSASNPSFDLTFRNRTRVAASQETLDWDSLYPGMSASLPGSPGNVQIAAGATLVGWDEAEDYVLVSSLIQTNDFSVTVSTPGVGYSTFPDFKIGVTFEESPLNTANGGATMEGYAVPDKNGGVAEIVITQQGYGYKSVPAVTIDAPPFVSTALIQTGDVPAPGSPNPDQITNLSDTSTLAVDMTVTGTNIPVGATIASIDSANDTITLSAPVITGAGVVGETLTFRRVQAEATVEFTPTYPSQLEFENIFGGDDSTVLMASSFTGYDNLMPGQGVYGEGVSPGTVITRILPGLQKVEVTPGGLPTRLEATNPGMQFDSAGSTYHTDGYDDVLRMPATFNEFHDLRVGQRVTIKTGVDSTETTVITAIDPLYRELGLREISNLSGQVNVVSVVFESLTRVDFGVISRTGSGEVSFGVEPFGYQSVSVTTSRVASGTATLKTNDEQTGRFELEVKDFEETKEFETNRQITGTGLNDGYRVATFDGRNIRIKSASLTPIAGSPDTFQLDDSFTAFGNLSTGMPVFGETVSGDIKIQDFDSTAREITLQGGGTSSISGNVIFGNPFTNKYLGNQNAVTGISVHREEPTTSSVIAASNIRDTVGYTVATEGGATTAAGSLSRHMLLAQRNEYHTSEEFVSTTAALVTFSDAVSSIELSVPLPAITTNNITIDGTKVDGTTVEVVGRFITQTESGDAVLSDTVIDGLKVVGSSASGTVLRNLQIGGFQNGSTVLVDDADGVLVDEFTIGITGNRVRSAADYGVLITGNSKATTILDTEIVSSERAGIRIEGESTQSRILNVTVGRNYGNQRAPDVFWNEVGIEVAANDVLLGHDVNSWKVLGADSQENTPHFHAASLVQNDNWVELSLSAVEWKDIRSGLAVIGQGIKASSFIESVDVLNERVYLSEKPTISEENALVLIGSQASGLLGTKEVTFDNLTGSELYVGQTVSIISGVNESDVLRTSISVLNDDGTVLLADELPSIGMYQQGIRLVEFGDSPGNVVEYSRTGVSVGLFGQVSASSSATVPADGNVLTMGSGFRGWSSVAQNMKLFVSTGSGVLEFTVRSVDQAQKRVLVNEPISEGFLNAPVRFDAADRFTMRGTQISNSIEDGLLIGGGSDHQIGVSSGDITVYGSRSDALAVQSGDQEVFELSSYVQNNVSAIPTFVTDGSGRELLGFDVDSGASGWLRQFLPEEIVADGYNAISRDISVHGKRISSDAVAEGLIVSNNVVTRVVTNISTRSVQAFSGGTVYLGLGAFVALEPEDVQLDNFAEGAGIYEFLQVRAVLRKLDSEESGFIALSTPLEGLDTGSLPAASGDATPQVIRFVNRSKELSNQLSLNGGFGVSVVDGNPSTQLYETVIDSWRIAGNYIDLSYDIVGARFVRLPNVAGSLSPQMFAAIFGQENDGSILYSDFDRTDDFGNQYAIEQEVSSDTGDNPFDGGPPGGDGDGDGDGDGGGDDGGTPPEPEVPIWPGVPF
ncbi:hypothetical protein N9Z08_00915 [Pirellulales bacterium]|nr:hypothetical protein [Pirellulales bacterium]